MTSRELVRCTLDFKNPSRVPRKLNYMPWTIDNYSDSIHHINTVYPDDIKQGVDAGTKCWAPTSGNPYAIGEFTDEWGCVFTNIHGGIIGEVKQPLVITDEWEDTHKVRFPEEWVNIDPDKVNAACAQTEQYVIAGCCPRPFEQLQFIRGTENLYVDLMLKPAGMMAFIEKMQDLYCRQLEAWAKTDVDALIFMDDWGSQRSLLINPKTWEEVFLPLYKDYINIAHKYGKKAFMHSDGYIMQILPQLIDAGLDAVNAQIFCMGIENLKQFAGKITFYGEIDRQHILSEASLPEVDAAVRRVFDNLWAGGGCIAMCEFGPSAKPENVVQVYKTWSEVL